MTDQTDQPTEEFASDIRGIFSGRCILLEEIDIPIIVITMVGWLYLIV